MTYTSFNPLYTGQKRRSLNCLPNFLPVSIPYTRVKNLTRVDGQWTPVVFQSPIHGSKTILSFIKYFINIMVSIPYTRVKNYTHRGAWKPAGHRFNPLYTGQKLGVHKPLDLEYLRFNPLYTGQKRPPTSFREQIRSVSIPYTRVKNKSGKR